MSFPAGFRGQDGAKLLKTGERSSPGTDFVVSQLAAAWRALETVRVVELELGQRRKRCVTRGSRQAAEVLRVLGLSQQLDPPPPPAGRETIM